MKLSILDFGDVSAAADLLFEADRLGYERYWLGEHHTRWQCANPMLLGALLAASSRGIRVGSGGVCLDYHSPYRIAEDARLIAFMLPGRFDLGVTRGLTLRPELSAALLDGSVADRRDQHMARLAELHGCLTGRLPAGHPLYGQDLHLEAGPPMWVLGVSEDTARWAGRHGTGFCFSLHHAPGGRDGRVVVDEYKRAFVPSPEFAEPTAIVMVSVSWEAEPPAERRSTNILIVGSAAEAATGLMATARHCGVEEIMALLLGVPDHAGLVTRYRALAGEVGMARRAAVPSAMRPALGGSAPSLRSDQAVAAMAAEAQQHEACRAEERNCLRLGAAASLHVIEQRQSPRVFARPCKDGRLASTKIPSTDGFRNRESRHLLQEVRLLNRSNGRVLIALRADLFKHRDRYDEAPPQSQE